jgi:hypothetical protein
VAGNKTDFSASSYRFRATEMLPLKSFSSAVTINIYALCHTRSPRDATLHYVLSLVCLLVSAQLSLDRFPCSFLLETCMGIFLGNRSLVKTRQKCGVLYIRPKYVSLQTVTLNLYKVFLTDRSVIRFSK